MGSLVTNAMRAILDVWIEGSLPKPILREAFRAGDETRQHHQKSGRDVSPGMRNAASALTEIRKGSRRYPKGNKASGPALRTALEERLKRVSREDGIDLQRLRRHVAFDRFLARLFRGPNTNWVLKGGYAMETCVPNRAHNEGL